VKNVKLCKVPELFPHRKVCRPIVHTEQSLSELYKVLCRVFAKVSLCSVLYMPSPTVAGREHYLFRSSVELSVCILTPVLCDAISLQLLDRFQWNSA